MIKSSGICCTQPLYKVSGNQRRQLEIQFGLEKPLCCGCLLLLLLCLLQVERAGCINSSITSHVPFSSKLLHFLPSVVLCGRSPPPIWRPSINVSLAVGNEIVFQIFRDTLSVDEKGRKPVLFQGPGTLTDRKCIGLLRFFFWLDLENLQSGSFPLAKQVKCVFFSRCQ